MDHGVPGHYAPCRSSRGQLGDLLQRRDEDAMPLPRQVASSLRWAARGLRIRMPDLSGDDMVTACLERSTPADYTRRPCAAAPVSVMLQS